MPNDNKTTKQAAKALDVSVTTLLKYVKDSAFPPPEPVWRGTQKLYAWSDALIAKYRAIIEGRRK